MSADLMNICVYILLSALSLCGSFALTRTRFRSRQSHIAGGAALAACSLALVIGFHCGMPVLLASFLLLFLPMLLVSWYLARLRDFRFFFTYFNISMLGFDMVALLLLLLRNLSIGFFPLLLITAALFGGFFLFVFKCRHYYRRILNIVTTGWVAPTVLTLLFYLNVCISLYYPTIITERSEAIPSCLLTIACSLSTFFILMRTILLAERGASMRQKERQLKSDIKLARMEKMLYFKQAYTDALTGLSNRAACIEKLAQLEMGDDFTSFVLWALDANNLKVINDSHGHSAGDVLLCGIARALQELDVPGKSTFRTGGDEYVALFEDCTMEQARHYAEQFNRITNRINAQDGIAISVSLGMACSNECSDVQQVWALADERMYASKKLYKSAHPSPPRT